MATTQSKKEMSNMFFLLRKQTWHAIYFPVHTKVL
jgi:hypothetical protein